VLCTVQIACLNHIRLSFMIIVNQAPDISVEWSDIDPSSRISFAEW
jgi:hypothetical protein